MATSSGTSWHDVAVAKAGKRPFGSVRTLPSGRRQARYTGPDGRLHSGPVTFDTDGDALAWLSLRHSEILRGAWLRPPPEQAGAPPCSDDYATTWLAGRDLQPRTRAEYTRLYKHHLEETFGNLTLARSPPATSATGMLRPQRSPPRELGPTGS